MADFLINSNFNCHYPEYEDERRINNVGSVLIIIAFSYIANLIIASAQIVRMGGLLIE